MILRVLDEFLEEVQILGELGHVVQLEVGVVVTVCGLQGVQQSEQVGDWQVSRADELGEDGAYSVKDVGQMSTLSFVLVVEYHGFEACVEGLQL